MTKYNIDFQGMMSINEPQCCPELGKATGKYKSFYDIHTEGDKEPVTTELDCTESWQKQTDNIIVIIINLFKVGNFIVFYKYIQYMSAILPYNKNN